MGRGFFGQIDNLGEGADVLNPAAHDALASHFIASGFDIKSVLRLLVSIDESTPCGRASVEPAVDIIRKFHARFVNKKLSF